MCHTSVITMIKVVQNHSRAVLRFKPRCPQNWVERVQSGKFYHQSDKKALPVPHSTYLLSRKLLITAAKQCPVDSPRNPGRQGHVFHAIEYGPYYQVLEFPRPWHWWIRYYRSGEESGYKSVIATTKKGVRPLKTFE